LTGQLGEVREVASELAKLGYKNERGSMFNAASIASMVA
jgi:hypothetical protein